MEDGLEFACILDGHGGCREIGWSDIRTWQPQQGVMWVHLNYRGRAAQAWISGHSGVHPLYGETLLAEETRPRVVRSGDALLVVLRGINLNPGAEPEDMVAVRIWIDAQRIVTVLGRRMTAILDLREALLAGRGPAGPGEFLVQLGDTIMERIAPVIAELDEALDELEDMTLSSQSAELHARLGDARRAALLLRRHIAPQTEALARLHIEEIPWLQHGHRLHLREIYDRTMHYIEDLNLARERAAVTQDEVNNRISHQMNRTIYLLTIVATMMLPLNLITGALGINVGGIPGANYPSAFFIVLGILVVVALVVAWLLRRFNMI